MLLEPSKPDRRLLRQRLVRQVLDGDRRRHVDLDTFRRVRIDSARRNEQWTELEEAALVKRGPWLVHVETDELYTRYRAPTFHRSARIEFGADKALHFFVDQAGDVVVLERSQQPRTWSEVAYGRARTAKP